MPARPERKPESAYMPMVVAPLAEATGASFEVLPVVNTLFGVSVTTAGLLPGAAIRDALRLRGDMDLALLPAESVNDDGLFMDGMSVETLAATSPVEIRFSKDFADALELGAAA